MVFVFPAKKCLGVSDYFCVKSRRDYILMYVCSFGHENCIINIIDENFPDLSGILHF